MKRSKEYFIASQLFVEYGVKKGLRNMDGSGVLAGLTNISKIIFIKMLTGKSNPARANFGIADTKLSTDLKMIWAKREVFRRIFPVKFF